MTNANNIIYISKVHNFFKVPFVFNTVYFFIIHIYLFGNDKDIRKLQLDYS